MKCDNKLCIYEEKNKCTNKNSVEIDWRGCCKNMVPIRVTRNTLNSSKIVTQLELNDGKHLFNSETGEFALTGDAIEFYDKDF